MISFDHKIKRTQTTTVQVNVGKYCNQACHHCHVEAGPKRTEKMTRETAQKVVDLIASSPSIQTVDLTGGAPELHPQFRFLVEQSRQLGKEVLDRCNLTALTLKGQEDTAQFLADNEVTVIASLPCYSHERVNKQRGGGVFEQSLTALKLLNKLGYGQDESHLKLHLVYNPLGPHLPPPQEMLHEQYKAELKKNFGIVFNELFAITNMPISRFLWDLKRNEQLDEYMQLLQDNFNPQALSSVMCKSLISISWDGLIYDCDFNQMLDIPLAGKQQSIFDLQSFEDLWKREVAVGSHCFGCTAGTGSSCGGSLVGST